MRNLIDKKHICYIVNNATTHITIDITHLKDLI